MSKIKYSAALPVPAQTTVEAVEAALEATAAAAETAIAPAPTDTLLAFDPLEKRLSDRGIATAVTAIAHKRINDVMVEVVDAARLAERKKTVAEIQTAIAMLPPGMIPNRVNATSLQAILSAAFRDELGKGVTAPTTTRRR